MWQDLFRLVLAVGALTAAPTLVLRGQSIQPDDGILAVLTRHQYNMQDNGLKFVIDEAQNNDYFLLGELHGDNEIPALLRTLWPAMWKAGYRSVAAEVSPWAANQLESVPPGAGVEVIGTWTRPEAASIHALAGPNTNVLWGCDMEEIQPQYLIRELAALNVGDPNLTRMAALTRDGYNRKLAPELLALAKASKGSGDKVVNDVSLRQNLLATLQIEPDRLSPDTRMVAQNERELLMKEQFLAHVHRSSASPAGSKVLLRFGRNHLHRGYDARGISTLGNFIAEFAIAQGRRAFNVGAFGAGGKASLMGETFEADERRDELAFSLLAEAARYPETLYDLRPVRPLLHRVPQDKRSALESNLIYWADSYDALICYLNPA